MENMAARKLANDIPLVDEGFKTDSAAVVSVNGCSLVLTAVQGSRACVVHGQSMMAGQAKDTGVNVDGAGRLLRLGSIGHGALRAGTVATNAKDGEGGHVELSLRG